MMKVKVISGIHQPSGFGFNWSSNYTVYLETLEQFDFTDGTSGMLDGSIYDDATEIDPNWFFEMREIQE